MGKVHDLVTDVCGEYFQRMRRYVYVTPKSYLAFIDQYKQVYKAKFDGMVQTFVDVYPTLITAQALALGDMFNRAEYPTATDIAALASFTVYNGATGSRSGSCFSSGSGLICSTKATWCAAYEHESVPTQSGCNQNASKLDDKSTYARLNLALRGEVKAS